MTVCALKFCYGVFYVPLTILHFFLMTFVTIQLGVLAIQRKARKIMVEPSWKPIVRIVTAFAIGDAILGETITVDIFMTLRAR